MEFQIGQVFIRVTIDILQLQVKIKVIAPISDETMEVTNIVISNEKDCPVTFESVEYAKGDRDEEKSAIS